MRFYFYDCNDCKDRGWIMQENSEPCPNLCILGKIQQPCSRCYGEGQIILRIRYRCHCFVEWITRTDIWYVDFGDIKDGIRNHRWRVSPEDNNDGAVMLTGFIILIASLLCLNKVSLLRSVLYHQTVNLPSWYWVQGLSLVLPAASKCQLHVINVERPRYEMAVYCRSGIFDEANVLSKWCLLWPGADDQECYFSRFKSHAISRWPNSLLHV